MTFSPALRAGSVSLLIHAALLAPLFFLVPDIVKVALPPIRLFVPSDLLLPPRTTLKPSDGGGSGAMTLAAAQGQLPPASPRVFVQPAQVRPNEQPLLELPPSIDMPADTPNIRAAQWGDPLAKAGPPSDGRGRRRTGIGDGDGPGVGDGPGAGVFRIGGGVTAPKLLFHPEPEYSEEARKAKYQGEVGIRIVVDEQGAVRHVEVTRPLGLGLDERAVEAVRKWRFQPGRRDGKPVPVWANVDVYFRLL